MQALGVRKAICNMPKHGEYIKDGEWSHSRWCEVCNHYHGNLYPCPNYPPELLQELELGRKALVSSLSDQAWIKQQIEKGIPPEAILIMRALAGM